MNSLYEDNIMIIKNIFRILKRDIAHHICQVIFKFFFYSLLLKSYLPV